VKRCSGGAKGAHRRSYPDTREVQLERAWAFAAVTPVGQRPSVERTKCGPRPPSGSRESSRTAPGSVGTQFLTHPVTSSALRGVQRKARAAYSHRDGKPREVLTDQGRRYFAWRGKSAFQKLLEPAAMSCEPDPLNGSW
jgi:hypothetical protein